MMWEIIILVIGALLATISFFVPDKGGNGLSEEIRIDDETIKSIVDEEVRKAKESIDEASKLSISDSKDKLERYMDRLTNEKMMAVGEYSDTVIKQIKKDHEEAVFLYDMIDNKHSQVKNTAAELGQLQKDVKRLSEQIPASGTAAVTPEPVAVTTQNKVKETVIHESEPASESNELVEIPAEVLKDVKDDFEALTPEVVDTKSIESTADESMVKKETSHRRAKEHKEEAGVTGPMGNESVELMFDSDSNSINNNDRILALHKEGKSNMAIAKELGLGVGEVKLVLDLFNNL